MADSKDGNALPPAVVELIAGLLGGGVSTLSLHPLDLRKNPMQSMEETNKTSPSVYAVASVWADIFLQITVALEPQCQAVFAYPRRTFRALPLGSHRPRGLRPPSQS